MKNRIMVFTICLIALSCNSQKNERIKKFIYLKTNSIFLIDSLGNPHLSLEEYFEYTPNESVKIAKCDYLSNKKSGKLSRYFEFRNIDTLTSLLERTLGMNSYKSFYGEINEGSINVFVFKTQNGDKSIEYTDGDLPVELNLLDSYIRTILRSKCTMVKDSVKVSNYVFDFEKQIIARHKPPKVIIEPIIPDSN